MKRSAVLKIIESIMEHSCSTYEKDAETILNKLEELGMSPPFVDEIDDNLELIGRKWEKEDET